MNTPNNNALDEITEKLHILDGKESKRANIDTLRKFELINAVPDEYASIIEDIATKYRNMDKELKEETKKLRAHIATLAVDSGHTKMNTPQYMISPRHYPPKWDSDGLIAYAEVDPTILTFRTKEAYVTAVIRRKKSGKKA